MHRFSYFIYYIMFENVNTTAASAETYELWIIDISLNNFLFL